MADECDYFIQQKHIAMIHLITYYTDLFILEM